MEVAASGFAPERRTNVVVQTGQAARLNFALQVGQVSQRADVVAEVPLMQTENAALGEVVSTERVTNLPLNGRRFIDLAALTPGVTVRTESQFSLVRANGTRDTTMSLTFDGVKATANRWAFVAIFPPLDAIQEFRVQTGNYTAEYGGNAGANVNVQLRSGTNALHGNLYEFLRNDKLDARNYFSPAPLPKDVLRRNQFGAVVSGPIVKDKVFFMVGWESQRNNQESAGSDIVLTPAQTPRQLFRAVRVPSSTRSAEIRLPATSSRRTVSILSREPGEYLHASAEPAGNDQLRLFVAREHELGPGPRPNRLPAGASAISSPAIIWGKTGSRSSFRQSLLFQSESPYLNQNMSRAACSYVQPHPAQ